MWTTQGVCAVVTRCTADVRAEERTGGARGCPSSALAAQTRPQHESVTATREAAEQRGIRGWKGWNGSVSRLGSGNQGVMGPRAETLGTQVWQTVAHSRQYGACGRRCGAECVSDAAARPWAKLCGMNIGAKMTGAAIVWQSVPRYKPRKVFEMASPSNKNKKSRENNFLCGERAGCH